MKKGRITRLFIIAILLCINTACEVERKSRNLSNDFISNSSIFDSSNDLNTTSTSSPYVSPNGLPKEANQFIDLVNSIEVNIYAGEKITLAFELWDQLVDWDYPEVLEAYDKLCIYEEEYNILASNREKINLFLDKVLAFPSVFTLNDEYLIIRAEDSYSKLSDELKSDPDVIAAYEVMVSTRIAFEQLKEEILAQKDEDDAKTFLDYVNKIPNTELPYSYNFVIDEGIEMYNLLSENAKAKAGVSEAFKRMSEARSLIVVKDGTGLFEVNIIHKATNWESMVDIQGKDEQHKVTGIHRVYNFKAYENGVLIDASGLLKWGDSPSDTSYTRSNGLHSFSFTIKKAYSLNNNYKMSFIIETDAGESFLVELFYMVDKRFTCNGYSEQEFYYNQLSKRVDSLIREDYSDESWLKVEQLLEQGQYSLNSETNTKNYKAIVNQYYQAIKNVERRFTELKGASVIEVSSTNGNLTQDKIFDGKTTTRWQAASLANEYIIIDMGATYSLEGMSIMWQNSNARDYTIMISNENANWDSINPIYSFYTGISGDRIDEVRFNESISGRYIKIYMSNSTTNYGCSIYEIYLYQTR